MSEETTNLAKLTISFERTISVRQYEPVKVSGFLSFGAETPTEQIDILLAKFDEYGSLLAEEVLSLADARVAAIRDTLPPEEPRKTAAPRSAGPVTARAPRKANPVVNIGGRDVESWTNRDGQQSFKAKCETCDNPVYFQPSVNRTSGQEYSAEDNVKSAIKFQGGFYCKDHRPARGAARPAAARQTPPAAAPVQYTEDDDF